MDKVKLPVHKHSLLPFTRFSLGLCEGCRSRGYIYEGYRCNESRCDTLFHKECAESLPEINHPSHPDHPLKLAPVSNYNPSFCGLCRALFMVGYFCSICDFKLDLGCAKGPGVPLLVPEVSNVHEHPLKLLVKAQYNGDIRSACKLCGITLFGTTHYYTCCQCELLFHTDCVEFVTEAYHSSHPRHPLKFLTCESLDYADKECLLCGMEFHERVHHCDVCNVSICSQCVRTPPPLVVESPKTHEHGLHLVPRRMDFTCNACGTQGARSPYFCLQCNFMIHRECIDLPRLININRHDHRISYTRRLGHGNLKCGVCRKKVDGFYGGYSCSKCSNYYVVHARCATRKDVWDMVELEGTPEEEEIPPFEVIDDNTIKHFSHHHNLSISKDGQTLHESTLCQACVLQISSETFYGCNQCDFTLHQKCANLPRKKRHACHNQPFKLQTKFLDSASKCVLCNKMFTGFRYESDSDMILDVRCASMSEPFVHKSHQHPLYYCITDKFKRCSHCGNLEKSIFSCDDESCDFNLDYKCAGLPQKVMKHRYDDHPLILSCGESNVDGEYWCEACETKVNPRKWFYTCNNCGITLHISCIVGDFSYTLAGSELSWGEKVVPNTSICRVLCSACNVRCKLPSILQVYKTGVFFYMCSSRCRYSRKI
ncbi:uncharacterized protein LOC108854095 [Raphanus sativus]|uniref:Uncharacterized protein LOC108854095 n=1 Tax=Raphanus sativus TaxID=3726 RepID=A0A9W3DL52_RAPSA|nr:uncharacterized protein LOC108854095 [Raphanus sativus]